MKTAFHIDEIYLRHRNPEGHPERGERIGALLELAQRSSELGVTIVNHRRRALTEELTLAHTPEYVEAMASTVGRSLMLDPDTFTCPDSYDVACHAAGAMLELTDRVIARDIENAFAAVRPPGHHAETERAMGFCLFNNVAIAAAHALRHHGLQRVLIVDWDVHHGNGTQEIFWSDHRVLYLSLHQFPFYPGTGRFDEIGGDDGRGYTVNIPMPAGFGDTEWIAAFRRVVEPVAHAYNPQLVLVSAGFDAHASDPLGGMRVSEQGFEAMAQAMLSIAREHASGRLLAVLEGGYDIAALSSSVETVLRQMTTAAPGVARAEGGLPLAGNPTRAPFGFETTRPAAVGFPDRFGEVFARVKEAQSSYWKL